MTCILVDDEPLALKHIEKYVMKTPMLELRGSFTNPFEALTFLISEDVDLLFLDINMPELNGMQLINSLPKKPKVIFTTAYSEFGAESYNYDAIDYLLKPITYERFLRAVMKAFPVHPDGITVENVLKTEENVDKGKVIMVKSSSKLHRIALDDILFIEAAGNYWSFQLVDKKILALLPYNDLMELLPKDQFVRIHRSFIVPLAKIEIVERHQVTISGKTVPIGITYREHFNAIYRG